MSKAGEEVQQRSESDRKAGSADLWPHGLFAMTNFRTHTSLFTPNFSATFASLLSTHANNFPVEIERMSATRSSKVDETVRLEATDHNYLIFENQHHAYNFLQRLGNCSVEKNPARSVHAK